MQREGRTVGLSMFAGYSYNERSYLSLGVVDADVQIGDVLTLVWGEGERHAEDNGRAAPANRDPRQSGSGPLLPRCTGELCRGLAHPADGVNARRYAGQWSRPMPTKCSTR